jgi:hypothetical protein
VHLNEVLGGFGPIGFTIDKCIRMWKPASNAESYANARHYVRGALGAQITCCEAFNKGRLKAQRNIHSTPSSIHHPRSGPRNLKNLSWLGAYNIFYSTNLCATHSRLPYFKMMSSRSNFFCYLTSAILLTHSMTQALRPLRAPGQIITKIDETPHNGSAVPGASPVKYHNDPGNDLFRIESLDMYPNPCVLYVFYSRFPSKSSTQS